MSPQALSDQLASVFAAFDAQGASTVAAFVTEDVQVRLGNAPMTQGCSAFVDAINEFHIAERSE